MLHLFGLPHHVRRTIFEGAAKSVLRILPNVGEGVEERVVLLGNVTL